MTNPNFPDDEEKPLDPAMEKLRRKMVRLLVISSSVIVLGLMAVLGSIVYKASKNSTVTQQSVLTSGPIAPQQSITLPKDFVLESTTIDGNRVWFLGTAAGKHLLIVHDIGTAKTLTTITVAAP